MSSVYLGWGKSVFCEITRVDDGQLLLIIVVVKSVSSLSLNSFPVFFLLAFVVSLIGVDDACDELVTDNIFLGKFYDGNTFYSFQYLQGFLQSTFALFWQVDLCHHPMRVRNILICAVVVFCASSRMTTASLSVRPRMKARGAICMMCFSIRSLSLVAGSISCKAS